MLLIADRIDTLARCFPAAMVPAAPDAARLEEPERALWEALAPGVAPWVTRVEGDSSAGNWPRVYLVSEAARSQFDILRERQHVLASLPGPVACVALTGRGFHGHRERTWAAPRGNLHLSVGFAPHRPASRLVPGMVMLPAVAVVDCLRALEGVDLDPKIKWVNDVLIDGRKVAGVLTTTSSQGANIDSAVLGVGVNVACAPIVEPTPFVPTVGCLAGPTCPAPRFDGVLRSLLARISARYEELLLGGAAGLWRAYCDASMLVGEEVRIYDESYGERSVEGPWPEPIARGIVERIDEDLGLRLRGRREPVMRGRLALESSCVSFGL